MKSWRQEKRIIDGLARRIADAAAMPIQSERSELWKACNKLQPKRAMVLANPQNGWSELVPESILQCDDPFFRSIEKSLRMKLCRIDSIHDDFPITDVFHVRLKIEKSDYGVENKVTRSQQKDGAYHIEPSIRDFGDLKKLRPASIRIDREATDKEFELVQDILGDILKVEISGVGNCRCGLTRVLIHLRGLDQMMYDMYDNPELLHDLMSFLRDEQIREYEFYEKEEVLDLNNGPESWTGAGGLAYTDELPSEGFEGRVRLKDMTVWGESQETGSVGPKQFEEFVLQYQLPIMDRFGLVDYGCCESLDTKFDLLIDKISRLRWVAVSPWCDREIAAEKLGEDYVFVYKPNPSYLCSETPDFEAVEKQVRDTLEMAEGCAVHIVMKDTSTFWNQSERITRWTDMATRIAEEMA